jgi:von Willebrand factor A domain-containing protein 8
MEFIDYNRRLVTYIPVPRVQSHDTRSSTIQQHDWHMFIKSGSGLLASQCQDGSLLTIDSRANIHHWEITPSHLQISLDAWNKQTNRSTNAHSLDIEYLKDGRTDLNGPKHGKIDPENQPHVGGNQWAGGSGGRDTAGNYNE